MSKNKKLLSVIMVAVLTVTMLGIWPKQVAYGESLTTVPDGYVGIYTPDDFNNMRNNVHGHYILMNNLDLTGLTASGNGWVPIGTAAAPFDGILDGNGYSVSGLRITTPTDNTTSYVGGLFAYAGNATINNLTLGTTADLIVSRADRSLVYGGLIGESTNVTVTDCKVDLQFSGKAEQLIVGGLIGRQNLFFVKSTGNENERTNVNLIQNAAVSGNISVLGKNYYIGGMVGEGRNVKIDNSTNAAAIRGTTTISSNECFIAGFIGNGHAYDITGCTNNGTLSTTEADALSNGNVSMAGMVVDGSYTCALNTDGTYDYLPKKVTTSINNGPIDVGDSGYAIGIVSPADANDVNKMEIVGCVNNGFLSAFSPAESGGTAASIAYQVNGGFIKECYNTGRVLASYTAAGIVDSIQLGEVQECYNVGSIEATLAASGITELNLDLIENCYNTGNIKADRASGLSVYNSSYALINNSYNVGGVESTAIAAAGITGENDAIVGDTYYYENTKVGVADNQLDGIDGSEKIYLDQLDDEATYAGFDFGEPIQESSVLRTSRGVSYAAAASTGVWKISTSSGLPKLNDLQEVYVTGLSLIQAPTKKTYLVNESVSTTGLIVKASLSNGKSVYLMKGFAFKPYAKTAGTRNITLSYAGHTASFPVTFTAFRAAASAYGQVALSWNGVSGATSYKIYRATSSTGTYSLVYTAGSSTRSYINKGLTTGKTYYYKMRPMYGTKYGTASAAQAIKVIVATPSVRYNIENDTTLNISWNQVQAGAYEIYRSTSLGGTYSKIKTTSVPNVFDTSLVAGKTYYYKVRAYYKSSSGVKYYGNFSTPKCINW